MKLLLPLGIALVAAAVWGTPVHAQATKQSGQSDQAPVQTVERRQGKTPVYHTEVKPGLWVHGRPDKPIFSGTLPIYPEAYDYMPAPGGAR